MFAFEIFGCVPLELPPKFFERTPGRDTESSFILSSMVMGKISSPIFESLVKTDTSSRDFFSGFNFVYQKYREAALLEALGEKPRLTFRITDRALDNSWSGSGFTTRVALSARMATSGLDSSRLTETDNALFR